MNPRLLVKHALPWLVLALAMASIGYTWKWALAKSSERHRMHHAFTTGTTQYIFGLCPSTSLVEATPEWARTMKGHCRAHQPTWGRVENGVPRTTNLDIETGSTWEALQLLSRLVLEISPGKMLSLVSLVVISLAGVLGLQRRGWLHRQGLNPRLRITRGPALLMLSIVLLALSASLVLLDEQETLSMCQMTGGTYANLLSVDARCSQQTTLLRDTQALLEQKKGELDSRARELDELKREIASLGAVRDALGNVKTELRSQSESTQQLIVAVTGATLDGITKALDPLHADMKGLDASLKTDFRRGLRDELQADIRDLVRGELRAALQGEAFHEILRREVRAVVREDVRAVVRGELQESMKTMWAASHASDPKPAPKRATAAVSLSVQSPAPERSRPSSPTPRKR